MAPNVEQLRRSMQYVVYKEHDILASMFSSIVMNCRHSQIMESEIFKMTNS